MNHYTILVPPTQSYQLLGASDIHDHFTRYATQGNIFQRYIRTTRYGLKSLQIMGGKLWTTIPNYIKDSQNKKIFVSCYKKTLRSSYAELYVSSLLIFLYLHLLHMSYLFCILTFFCTLKSICLVYVRCECVYSKKSKNLKI